MSKKKVLLPLLGIVILGSLALVVHAMTVTATITSCTWQPPCDGQTEPESCTGSCSGTVVLTDETPFTCSATWTNGGTPIVTVGCPGSSGTGTITCQAGSVIRLAATVGPNFSSDSRLCGF